MPVVPNLNAVQNYPLLEAVTVTGSGTAIAGLPKDKTFSASVDGTGAVAAVVTIDCATINGKWLTLGTITLAGTTSVVDGFFSSAPWPFIRATVVSLSGTGATVNVSVGA
jgi:hypothetical protein